MALQQGLITITGRVGSNPQGHGNGSPPTICTFRLGSTRGYYDANRKWRSLPTTWITVKAYRALAANVHASVRTGDPIIVVGVLATEEWTAENGEKRSRIVVEASNVGHDLNYGMTRPDAGKRDGGGASSGGGGGQSAVGNGAAGNETAGPGREPVHLLTNDPYQRSHAQANMPADSGAATGAGVSAGAVATGGAVPGGDGGAVQAGTAVSASDSDGGASRESSAKRYADGFAQSVQGANGVSGEIPPPDEPPAGEFEDDVF